MLYQELYEKYVSFVKYVARHTVETRIACRDDYIQAGLVKLYEISIGNKKYKDYYIKQCIRNAILDEQMRCTGVLSSSLYMKKKAINIIFRLENGESIQKICENMHLTRKQFYDLKRLVTNEDQSLENIEANEEIGIIEEDLFTIPSLTNEERFVLGMRISGNSLRDISNIIGKSVKWVWDRCKTMRRKVINYVR
jgi:RNA polymerase sigma factor (sigma-70 family)